MKSLRQKKKKEKEKKKDMTSSESLFTYMLKKDGTQSARQPQREAISRKSHITMSKCRRLHNSYIVIIRYPLDSFLGKQPCEINLEISPCLFCFELSRILCGKAAMMFSSFRVAVNVSRESG